LPTARDGIKLPEMVGAVIYVRVSTKEQTENLSLPTQLRACEEYCRRQGYDVLERFHEEGESAKTTDRSQLQALLKYCRTHKGKVHFVVVYNLTRFAREKYDHFALRAHLKSLGISLRSATEPIDDTSTGKLMEGVLAAFAPGRFDAFFDAVYRHFEDPPTWEVFQDVAPALSALRGLGCSLGIVSNFDSRVLRILEGLDLAPWFASVTLSSQVGVTKPDPAIFARALARHWADGAPAFHVGDSPVEDGEGARAAGLRAVLIDRAGRHADGGLSMTTAPTDRLVRDVIALEAAHVVPVYKRAPIVITHGRGALLYDAEGREYLDTAWWISTFPGLVLMLTSVAVSRTGDWLRDLLDPTLRGE